jgi:hypothetical protein
MRRSIRRQLRLMQEFLDERGAVVDRAPRAR